VQVSRAARRTTGFRALALRCGDQAFALQLLASGFLRSADRLGLFPDAPLGGLLKRAATLHLAKHTFALKLLLQNPEGLFDVVFAYENLQRDSPFEKRVQYQTVSQNVRAVVGWVADSSQDRRRSKKDDLEVRLVTWFAHTEHEPEFQLGRGAANDPSRRLSKWWTTPSTPCLYQHLAREENAKFSPLSQFAHV
jgi:hypothetical protein